MDIKKFSNSKKRDLKNNSNTEEDAERQREKKVLMCHCQIFKENLKSEDCVKILLIFLKNLEKEVKDIHKLALSNKGNQI